jgi:dihydroflavonol-4-reductase
MSSPVVKRVCVSGVNGFVGGHVARDLLDAGYAVNGTVRSLSDPPAHLSHLEFLHSAHSPFQAFEADFTVADSFDRAMHGCVYAVHCASPSPMQDVLDPEKELVAPAVQGTLSFLESCRKAGTVQKVVLTGCTTAITDEGSSGSVLDETVWNGKSSLTRQPSFYCKALVEKSAWDWAEKNRGIKLVVIHPTGVIGPSLVAGLSTTPELIKNIAEGHGFPGILDLSWSFVDVRDVSRAHIAALESECASGRYICADTDRVLHMRDVVALLSDMGYFPSTVRSGKTLYFMQVDVARL